MTTPPDVTALSGEERERVLIAARRERAKCPSCGCRKFQVGDALYLGFLFVSETPDAWFVALTCRNRSCAAPHTGLRLREKDFLASPG